MADDEFKLLNFQNDTFSFLHSNTFLRVLNCMERQGRAQRSNHLVSAAWTYHDVVHPEYRLHYEQVSNGLFFSIFGNENVVYVSTKCFVY